MPSYLPTPPPFPPLLPFLIILTLISSTSSQATSIPEYDDFVSDCGLSPFPVQASDCFVAPNCCFANGTIQLTTKNICVGVSAPTDQQLRIKTIEALSHLATNINLVCPNITKSIPSNCGDPDPSEVKDCTKEKDCCYIQVVDEQQQM